VTSEFQSLARNTQGVIPFAIGTGDVPKLSYLDFDGTVGEYAETAASVLNTVTGDIWILADIAASTYTSVDNFTILSNWDTGLLAYIVRIRDSAFELLYSEDGTATNSAKSENTGLSPNDRCFLAIQKKASTGDVNFFVNGVQLGTTVAGVAGGSPFSSNIYLGAFLEGDVPFDGRIYSVRIYDGFNYTVVGGETVQDFDSTQHAVPIGYAGGAKAGLRSEQNLLEATDDFENSVWSKSDGGLGSPPTLVYGTTYNFVTGGAGSSDRSTMSQTFTTSGAIGATNGLSIWLSSDVPVSLYLGDRGQTGGDSRRVMNVTTVPQRFFLTELTSSSTQRLSIELHGNVSGDVDVNITLNRAAVNDLTLRTNQNPPEYLSVGMPTGDSITSTDDLAQDYEIVVNGTDAIISGGYIEIGTSGIVTYIRSIGTYPEVVAGEQLWLDVTITGMSAGEVQPYMGGNQHAGDAISSDGVYSFRLGTTGGNGELGFSINEDTNAGTRLEGIKYRVTTVGFGQFLTENGNSVTDGSVADGPELVTSAITASDWVAQGNTLITDAADGFVKFEYVDSSNGGDLQLGDMFPVLEAVGAQYYYEVEAYSGTGSAVNFVMVGEANPTVSKTFSNTEPEDKSFNTEYASGNLLMRAAGLSVGESVYIKVSSIKAMSSNVVIEGEGSLLPLYPPIALNLNPTVTHPIFGPDGVIDGGFDTADPAWITGTANISGGVLNMTANGGSATQAGVVAVGTIARILVEWEQTILTGTRLRWISRNGLNSANSGTVVESSANLNPIAGNASRSGSFWALIDITDGYTFNLFNESGVTATVDNVRERAFLPAVDPITGAVWIFAPDDSIIVVAPVFLNGLPIDGLAAVYTADNGTVEYYSQGMPFDSGGRLVITTTGDIDHQGAGATPYDAAGRLCVAGETDLIYMGIAFAEGGKFASS